ncbi:hypothetical protein TKK_0009588 [Trichogramma kaykai]
MTACELNQIFVGEVASVQNYGAFVRIPGCKQQGLVHKSQVSSSHVDDVAEVLNRGDKIWCKVISIADDGKIALSMKLVNQGNGKDLDPNGVQLQLDEQKKKRFDPKAERKAIELDAIYKTVCSQCKTPGHIAKYCFTKPGGKTYELLPSEEEEERKRKYSTSDSDSSDSSVSSHENRKRSKKCKHSKAKHSD